MTGTHATYDVGPGQPYTEPDTVPWGALVAGDVVNIHARPTEYRWKLCLRGQGTASAPIIINGVTDAQGNRPRFNFANARTASGCNPGSGNNVFDPASQWSLEDAGGILIRAGVSDAWGTKPKFIRIQHLELRGAADGNSFTSINGTTKTYGSAAAVWIQAGADLTLDNLVISDNGFGVFTMAKNSSLLEACERITLRNSRIQGNGVVNSYLEHNVYMQSTNPVVEGNYFGPLRAGAEGSTYKSRSSGEIFRFNYVEASARAVDWVYSEDQTPGIATQADYGVDAAYGNVIVNDCGLGNCASNPIHYGGDNLGEQDGSTTLFTPTTPYRSRLWFFNNTVITKVTQQQSWRTSVFDLSLRNTTVEAWNNVFWFQGNSEFSWVELAGVLNLRGNNLVFGATPALASSQAASVNYSVVGAASVTTADPRFVNVAGGDFTPGTGSGAANLATAFPSGITPPSALVQWPLTMQPVMRGNGLVSRAAATSLGAAQ